MAGRNASRALFAARPQDIRKVYVDEAQVQAWGDLLKWCASQRLAYKVVQREDLEKLTDTPHHDGICLFARERPQKDEAALLRALSGAGDDRPLVLLEDVKNPHNLGAILRVCAHFGVSAVLAAGETPGLSAASMRTAEGGAEHVDVVPVRDAAATLDALKALGFGVIATSSHVDTPLLGDRLPRKAVVLFGSEGEGLSPGLMKRADHRVAIPGSGALESLNVACASSVVLWELWRARAANEPPRRAPPPAPSRRGKAQGRRRS